MHRVLVLSLLLLPLLLPNVSGAREAHAAPGSATADAMLPPPAWLDEVDALYDARIRVAALEDRAFSPEHWWDVAGPLATEARGFKTEEVGRSAEGRPLRHVSWGQGDKRVLLWSQMHGDESTASMAIADLFRFLGEHPDHPIVQRLRKGTTLHFLPVMNPDGAARFERRNGIPCMLRAPQHPLNLPAGVPLVAYRAAQEGLTNISKHAQATRVEMDLSTAGGVLSLEISDNGRGLNQEDLAKARSFGIRGLHERATTVGGWIDLSSGPSGTTLILSVPLDIPDSAHVPEPDTNKSYDPSQWADV